jgi:hypothetical protein
MKWFKYSIILSTFILELLVAFGFIAPADTKMLTLLYLALVVLVVASWGR